jgi:hypothetical protein
LDRWIRSLLVADPAASASRPTKDVDLIVDVPSRVAYFNLEAMLRSRGFREAVEEGAPICRWIVDGIRTDVMPVDPAILGFSNVWYFGTRESAITLSSSEGTIRVQDAPHFCASKLEAFASRGEGDLYQPTEARAAGARSRSDATRRQQPSRFGSRVIDR